MSRPTHEQNESVEMSKPWKLLTEPVHLARRFWWSLRAGGPTEELEDILEAQRQSEAAQAEFLAQES